MNIKSAEFALNTEAFENDRLEVKVVLKVEIEGYVGTREITITPDNTPIYSSGFTHGLKCINDFIQREKVLKEDAKKQIEYLIDVLKDMGCNLPLKALVTEKVFNNLQYYFGSIPIETKTK